MVSPLRKLVWTLVALAAMLVLAPMTASAHEGHRHGVAPASAAPTPAVEASDLAAAAEAPARVPAPSGLAPPASDAPCASGCCAGMVCCAVAIVSAPPALDPPPRASSQTSPRGPPRLSGLRPSSLLEPPNALT